MARTGSCFCFPSQIERFERSIQTLFQRSKRVYGKAENAVKTTKMLMKKGAESGNDFYSIVLEWQNTTSKGMDISPFQRMFSRRAKALLPISKELFQSNVVTGLQEKLRTRRKISQNIITETPRS